MYANVEAGQAGREDTARSMRAILDELATRARLALDDDFVDSIWPDVLSRSGPDAALRRVLVRWSQADARPLVLLLDEIECKVLHGGLERIVAEGLEQTAGYIDRCAAREGHLIVVDRGERKRWDDKVFHRRMTSSDGAAVDLRGM